MEERKDIALVLDTNLVECCDKISVIKGRAGLLVGLLHAFDLYQKLLVVSGREASESEIRDFHSEDYVDALKNYKEKTPEDLEDFGLGFDCPAFDGLWNTVCAIAGASVTAAELLVTRRVDIAINWCGGWHHAQRDSASGFCYINDIVLAIHKLKERFDRILYIDLDTHHGDGCENAYLFSNKIFTLSLHQLEAGFFPGTGHVNNRGQGRGTSYNVNIPYKSGVNDQQFTYLFNRVLTKLSKKFAMEVVVMQCGADALAQDPLGEANLTEQSYIFCFKKVLELGKPLLILGGGGYNIVNSAKLWTSLTACTLGRTLSEDIPEHNNFEKFGPDFTIRVQPSLRKSNNTQEYLDSVMTSIEENLNLIPDL